MKVSKYIILYGAPVLYAATSYLYKLNPSSFYEYLFSLGVHIIFAMLTSLPLIIEEVDPVFNRRVQGMLIYLVVNNVFNEAMQCMSIYFGFENHYSPLIDSIDKRIMFIAVMAITEFRVWRYRKNAKVWGKR